MAKIISIGTAVPEKCYKQSDILKFMQSAYNLNETESRKLAYLYKQSEIEHRYGVLEDFDKPEELRRFFSQEHGEPTVDERMNVYDQHASRLSIKAINNCIENYITPKEITHLITVSCTGMCAPGLDLQIAEELQLPTNVFRTSVNFMGCYAAIHGLKMAQLICNSNETANVIVVCTEICTIHFQQTFTQDNAASSLLFADGSAAVLVTNSNISGNFLQLKNFYSEVSYKGKQDMSWRITDKGFLMSLSSYIPQLIQEDIESLVLKALSKSELSIADISHWCIHPGGKKILEVIKSQLHLTNEDLSCSRSVLSKYGNMSSPTILFVLKEMLESSAGKPLNVFGVAFGPGLTMETFVATRP